MENIKKSLDGAYKLQVELNKFVNEVMGSKIDIPIGLKTEHVEYVYFLAKFAQLQERIDKLDSNSPFDRIREETDVANKGICINCNHNTSLGRTCKVKAKMPVFQCKEWTRRARSPSMEDLNTVRANLLCAFRTYMIGIFMDSESGKLTCGEFNSALNMWMKDERII